MEIERCLKTPSKVSSMVARAGIIPFSTPFSAEVVNAPRYRKVKMPTVDVYDGRSGGTLGSVQSIDICPICR